MLEHHSYANFPADEARQEMAPFRPLLDHLAGMVQFHEAKPGHFD